jgi:hypothetical protein
MESKKKNTLRFRLNKGHKLMNPACEMFRYHHSAFRTEQPSYQ